MTQQKQENSPKEVSTKTRKLKNMTQQKQENSPTDDSSKTRKPSKR